MAEALKAVEIVRVRNGRRSADADRAAAEEPLEVRLHGRSFAVIMRTPGADKELAAGFLHSERVIRSPEDLGTIEYCAGAENIINATLVGKTITEIAALAAERRQTMTSSSCGFCGRQTIESLQVDVGRLPPGGHVTSAVVSSLPGRLRQAQLVFDETGGLHAAGLFAQDGRLVACAEDVGRHNAVDKVIGRMVMADALPLSNRLLFVSGRSSFEIVQKALVAGIPIVASVSAPSSLAIELARDAGMTLIGFVRDEGFNIYTRQERVGDE